MTYDISITGIVQGVGFRPFVYQLAHELGLKGNVSNDGHGVHILVNAEQDILSTFVQMLKRQKPAQAIIQDIRWKETEPTLFEDFTIVASQRGKSSPDLSPDFGICPSCVSEMQDPNNRRYGYPYITCTDCGPRTSVITDLPYDRANTSMQKYTMCADCLEEYHNPKDRRFHSQSNSCPKCGIKNTLYDAEGTIEKDNPFEIIKSNILEGKIVAVKSTAGFILLCDAQNKDAIQKLRLRKQRPHKPLAVLMRDIDMVQDYANPSEKEKALLTSSTRPIVIIDTEHILTQYVSGKFNSLGIMLPSNGVLYCISNALQKSLVATSANISSSPIIYRDNEDLLSLADMVLTDDLPIVNPQDDSLYRVSKRHHQPILLRKGRGVNINFKTDMNTPLVGAGAELKGSFAINKDGKLCLSQYLGKMTDMDNQNRYFQVKNHYKSLFKISSDDSIVDKHPQYSISQNYEPTDSVQHHEAHFASVLQEHHLWDEKVLGVVWDGIGYGDDGNIWGGEFFICDKQIERIGHIAYYPWILGNKMSKECRISALALTSMIGKTEMVKSHFSDTEWKLYHRQIEQSNTLSSSMGRIFDAVSCMVLGIDKNLFEGYGAMMLEQVAQSYYDQNKAALQLSDVTSIPQEQTLKSIIQEVINDIEKNEEQGFIALKFHKTLALLIRRKAEKENIKNIAFSGGVFQNRLLVDLIIDECNDQFNLYFNERIPPNDENIALGQVTHYLMTKKQEVCV